MSKIPTIRAFLGKKRSKNDSDVLCTLLKISASRPVIFGLKMSRARAEVSVSFSLGRLRLESSLIIFIIIRARIAINHNEHA